MQLVDEETRDDFGRPKVLLEQELCEHCLKDAVAWYRESEPESLYLVPLPELTEEEREELARREQELFAAKAAQEGGE
jgi:hypothetical protein